MAEPQAFDFLVIGSGIAGLSFALRVADSGSVGLLTKKRAADSATNWAQGGIAAVLARDDSFDDHVRDTLEAGAGLCREDVVRKVVERAPRMIESLLDVGVHFDVAPATEDETGTAFDLGREGGHSRRRILHHRDSTGHEIETALLARVAAHPNIHCFEHHIAVDLLTAQRLELDGADRALGAYVLDRTTGAIEAVQGRVTLLATGGAGKVYLYTSNPDIASGDGIAMAYRAGARVANMEFMQFHPTCLFHPDAKSFLISEALRGEGAVLRTRDGRAFMAAYHPMADLAPRDVVARAIDSEMKRSGNEWVLLDVTHRDAEYLRQRFPTIHARCLEYGIDLTRQPVPVVPAAHYCCGGVVTDGSGETDIPNLFAAGEVACTGLHGANRLASNSLLEALVFSDAAASAARERLPTLPREFPRVPAWQEGEATTSDEAVVTTHSWDELRRFLWNYVGIVRSNRRLERARRRVEMLRDEVTEYYWRYKLTPDTVELRNLVTVAELVVESAQSRQESRGLHYTMDYPERDDHHFRRDTILQRKLP